MDAMTDKKTLANLPEDAIVRPTREEAEEAVRTLLRWAGDDPARARGVPERGVPERSGNVPDVSR